MRGYFCFYSIICVPVRNLCRSITPAHSGVVSTVVCWALTVSALQAKLDVSDEQKGALRQAMQKYRGEMHALAVERKSLNTVLAQAAAPGKPDSVKKVSCLSSLSKTTWNRCRLTDLF